MRHRPARGPSGLGADFPAAWTARADTGGDPALTWWTDFGDPSLDDVVESALRQNYDLQAAASRLEQALADSRVAGADLQPQLQVGLNGSQRKQNFIGFPIPGAEDRVLSTVFTNYGVSLDLTWEADLWGRLRAGARAALADLQSRAADLRAAQLSLAGQTTKAWFAIAEPSSSSGSPRPRWRASGPRRSRCASGSSRASGRPSTCAWPSPTSPTRRRFASSGGSSSTPPSGSSRC